MVVGDQPVGPVTNIREHRFENVFVFPDEYQTNLTWAAPLKIPGIFVIVNETELSLLLISFVDTTGSQ